MDLTLQFTDEVMHFCTYEDELQVLFRHQAAQYQLSKDQQGFDTLVAILSEAWRTQQSVVVTVSGLRIVGVSGSEPS